MEPKEFAHQLAGIYENNLESVILYGSAADGEFHKGHSDYNVLIVLKALAPIEIAKSGKLVGKWIKDGNSLPLFFSPEMISTSIDVFPIEFFDIKELHKVLFGNDPFAKMMIDGRNLRHQCEHELRSKLLTLYSTLPTIADQPKKLIKLITESSSSFFAIFRGVLRVAGVSPSGSKKVMIEQLTKLIDFDPAMFIEIIDTRAGMTAWRKDEALEKFEQYLTSIDAVVRFVDQM